MTLEKRQVSVGVPASSGENRRRKVNSSLIRWGTATLVALAMAGCGGGDSSGAPPPGTSVAAALAAAAAVPANDTAINSSASFTVVQDAGVPAVTVNSPPKVNFAVFSDGKVKSDLAIANVSFAHCQAGSRHRWQPGPVGELRLPDRINRQGAQQRRIRRSRCSSSGHRGAGNDRRQDDRGRVDGGGAFRAAGLQPGRLLHLLFRDRHQESSLESA